MIRPLDIRLLQPLVRRERGGQSLDQIRRKYRSHQKIRQHLAWFNRFALGDKRGGNGLRDRLVARADGLSRNPSLRRERRTGEHRGADLILHVSPIGALQAQEKPRQRVRMDKQHRSSVQRLEPINRDQRALHFDLQILALVSVQDVRNDSAESRRAF